MEQGTQNCIMASKAGSFNITEELFVQLLQAPRSSNPQKCFYSDAKVAKITLIFKTALITGAAD